MACSLSSAVCSSVYRCSLTALRCCAGNTLAAFNRAMGPLVIGQLWGLMAGQAFPQFIMFGGISVLLLSTCLLYGQVKLSF